MSVYLVGMSPLDKDAEQKESQTTCNNDLSGVANGAVCGDKDEKNTEIIFEIEEKPFTYDVYESPPVPMTFLFALQHMLMSLSRSLSTSLLVADILCARSDEAFKARLLSTTMFVSGACTLLQNVIGVRLPLYQGPSAMYVVPMLALKGLKSWSCPGDLIGGVPVNETDIPSFETKIQRMEGSLMIAGAMHMLVGLTGIAGLLLRFIGPVSVIPAITITVLHIYRAVISFCKVQWGVAFLTLTIAVILNFYLRNRQTPVPRWSRGRGFYITWFPVQKAFSVLIACLVGWGISGIITAAGGFSSDPDAEDFYARTDSRTYIVEKTAWVLFPYPGQFGSPKYDTGAFVTFLLGTLGSVIDSIGDYYACAKVIEAPPPPAQAVNRGLLVEGLMSFFAGWTGASHGTSTNGGNIGAIGFTRVASLRVFQVLGVLFILFGVLGKIGAALITIPYSVVGGMQMINFGILVGLMLSNLQVIDLKSTRNLAIIGMSMLIALMMPEWIRTTKDPINTGIEKLDDTLEMLLANPLFIAMGLACFLDNTVPGTKAERGLTAWQPKLMKETDKEKKEAKTTITEQQRIRMEKVCKQIYVLPYIGKFNKYVPWMKYLPFCPKGHGID